jgi:hypothetical protein
VKVLRSAKSLAVWVQLPDLHRGYARPTLACVGVLCVLILVFERNFARAEDLSLNRSAWNGLSELRAIASSQGSLFTPDRIDVSQLDASDALLIVHPVTPLPVAELAKFLRRGGRLAVADDFGTGRDLFAAFGMGMHAPSRDSNPRSLRNNPALLIATPLAGHALADGVAALVTNHPQVIYHPELTPIFSLSASRGAIVLSGAVGKGRLIAISDASVFINNMLELPGNRTFATNLLHFLRGGNHTRLYLAASDTSWLSGFRQLTTGNPLARVSAALAQLAKPKLPALAVIAIAVVLATVLLAGAATALPRRSAYARRAYLQTPDCGAGMAGRVHYYGSGTRNYLVPLLVLKLELEHRLVDYLAAHGQPQREEILRALKARGWSEDKTHELADFMSTVDRLQSGSSGAETLVSARRFSELAGVGRRILAELA